MAQSVWKSFMADDGSLRDGEMCAARVDERDRALVPEQQWKVDEFVTYRRTLGLLISQCQQRFNQSKYPRQCAYGGSALLLAPFPGRPLGPVFFDQRVWHFATNHMSAHCLRGSRLDSMDKAAGSSACWSGEREKRVGRCTLLVVGVVEEEKRVERML
jgi:hypothetical protein